MRNILITGGSSGIGFALTKKFAMGNFHVITISRNVDSLKKLKNVTYIQGDITVEEQLDKLVMATDDVLLDGIISNAGYGMPEPFKLTTMNEIDQHFQTNFFAPLKLIQKVLGKTAVNRVVNISSGAALRPLQSLFSYCTSKAAMHHAIECLNLEYPDTKFVNIRPGIVRTNLNEKWNSVDDSVFPAGNYIKNMSNFIPVETVADLIFKIWHLPDEEFLKDWDINELI